MKHNRYLEKIAAISAGRKVTFIRSKENDSDSGPGIHKIHIVSDEGSHTFLSNTSTPVKGTNVMVKEIPFEESSNLKGPSVIKRKATTGKSSADGLISLHVPGDSKYLLKRLPAKYGESTWLFKNLGSPDNKYLHQINKGLRSE